MTDQEERRIYCGAQRMADALVQLKAMRASVAGPLPLTDAEQSLDLIEDEFDSIEKKLKRALAILETEIDRIETLSDEEYAA